MPESGAGVRTKRLERHTGRLTPLPNRVANNTRKPWVEVRPSLAKATLMMPIWIRTKRNQQQQKEDCCGEDERQLEHARACR